MYDCVHARACVRVCVCDCDCVRVRAPFVSMCVCLFVCLFVCAWFVVCCCLLFVVCCVVFWPDFSRPGANSRCSKGGPAGPPFSRDVSRFRRFAL